MELELFSGRVIKRPFGGTSRSRRAAVMLDTGQRTFVLRRRGGNPFQDPVLDALVGKKINCRAVRKGYTLHMHTWNAEE